MTKEQFLQQIQKSYVIRSNGCWEWQGALNRGYAFMSILNECFLVHRIILYFKNNKWPDTTDHLCRNTKCINEDHLEDVTQKENVRRSRSANRLKTHCPKGHEYSKENTMINKNGSRICRICNKRRSEVYRLLR